MGHHSEDNFHCPLKGIPALAPGALLAQAESLHPQGILPEVCRAVSFLGVLGHRRGEPDHQPIVHLLLFCVS